MGRAARGVRGIRMREGDYVIDLIVVSQEATVLTVCEKGYGKRTDFDEYRAQGRGGRGIINIKTSKRNGSVVNMTAVRDDEDLMIVSHTGMIVRVPIDGISIIGRNTQGVRLIRLKLGDQVVSAARVPHEEPENGEGEEDEPAPPGPGPDSEAEASDTGPQPGEPQEG